MKSTPSSTQKKAKSAELPADLIEPRVPQKKEAGQPAAVPIRAHVLETGRNVGSPVELIDQIRVRAYELYLERGREPGHETEDWLRAEAELMARQV